MIEVRSVTRTYWNKTVIQDISFDIQQGEVVSFLWWSGVWKTTLLHALSWMDEWYTWTIMIWGVPLSTYLRKNNISYVWQRYTNFPWMKVKKNIVLGSVFSEGDQKVKRTLQHLDIAHLAERYPHELSWWQQQRVALARAILQESDIIALDEPFSALDEQTKSQLHQLLLEMVHEEWKTVLLVTHDIEEAVFLSDRVIVLWGQPGMVKENIAINFGQERTPTLVYQDTFQYYKRQIMFSIKSSNILDSGSIESTLDDSSHHAIWLYLWSWNAPFFHAVHAWYFAEKWFGVTFKSHLTYQSVEDELIAWTVSCAHMTQDRAELFCKNYQEYEIVGRYCQSYWADGLIAYWWVKSVSDLVWKKVWVERDSISEYFLWLMCERNGISLDELTVVHHTGLWIVNNLLNKKIDAWVLREPRLSKVQEYPDYSVIEWSEEYDLADVLVCSKKFMADNAQFIETVKHVWNKSIKDIKENEQSLREICSYINIPYHELKRTVEKLTFLEL